MIFSLTFDLFLLSTVLFCVLNRATMAEGVRTATKRVQEGRAGDVD